MMSISDELPKTKDTIAYTRYADKFPDAEPADFKRSKHVL